MSAANINDVDILKILLKIGIDVNTRDKYGETALMRAAHCKDLDIVKVLIENKADVNTNNNNGTTALMLAAGNNCTELFFLL